MPSKVLYFRLYSFLSFEFVTMSSSSSSFRRAGTLTRTNAESEPDAELTPQTSPTTRKICHTFFGGTPSVFEEEDSLFFDDIAVKRIHQPTFSGLSTVRSYYRVEALTGHGRDSLVRLTSDVSMDFDIDSLWDATFIARSLQHIVDCGALHEHGNHQTQHEQDALATYEQTLASDYGKFWSRNVYRGFDVQKLRQTTIFNRIINTSICKKCSAPLATKRYTHLAGWIQRDDLPKTPRGWMNERFPAKLCFQEENGLLRLENTPEVIDLESSPEPLMRMGEQIARASSSSSSSSMSSSSSSNVRQSVPEYNGGSGQTVRQMLRPMLKLNEETEELNSKRRRTEGKRD